MGMTSSIQYPRPGIVELSARLLDAKPSGNQEWEQFIVRTLSILSAVLELSERIAVPLVSAPGGRHGPVQTRLLPL